MCMAFSAMAQAQERTITNAKMVGVGYQNVQDTYLSPLSYSGAEIRYMSHTMRENDSSQWSRIIINEGSASKSTDNSGNGTFLTGMYRFEYGVVRSWTLMDDNLKLSVGGEADATAGFIYNLRGGNNTAQARASLNVGPKFRALYNIKKVKLSMEMSTPLMGLCFSPNYGQSYYEIFSRGDYDGNVVPTTFIATPSLRCIVAADVDLLNTHWRIGWLGDYHQQKVNGLKQHIYSNDLFIGIVRTINIK